MGAITGLGRGIVDAGLVGFLVVIIVIPAALMIGFGVLGDRRDKVRGIVRGQATEKACAKCTLPIPFAARRCPHCGGRQPGGIGSLFVVAIVILVVGAIVWDAVQ